MACPVCLSLPRQPFSCTTPAMLHNAGHQLFCQPCLAACAEHAHTVLHSVLLGETSSSSSRRSITATSLSLLWRVQSSQVLQHTPKYMNLSYN